MKKQITLEMEKDLIESMLKTALSNINAKKINEGVLILNGDATIEILANNNKYFLTYCPYDHDGENLSKTIRKEIASKFIELYSYENIKDMIKKQNEEKLKKIKKAKENKYKLENLINKYSMLKEYGNFELLEDMHLLQYYASFKRNYNIRLDIYLSDNGYSIKYNYETNIINEQELDEIIQSIINAAKEELKKEEEEKLKKEKELKKEEAYLNFAKEIQSGKIAIVKLKSSYQCIEKGIRYSIGKGKSGKYYNLKGSTAIIEYLKNKNITGYIFIEEKELDNIKNNLKSISFKNFN